MNRLVYSTETGRLCPDCQQAKAQCRCQQQGRQTVTADGKIIIQRESKGRKGKGVTLISGLPLDEKSLKALAKEMKQFCGTGGAVKQGVIEIQGDQRQKLKGWLEDKGYTAKLSGG